MAHLEKQLVIKRSSLSNAGKGLFTKKDIRKGIRIVEYKGKLRTWKDVNSEEEFNGYVFYINRNHVIDAKKTKLSRARYANDAKGLSKQNGMRNNCKYEQDGLHVYITAIRDIPAGSEILVGYGKEYWDIVKENKAR
ncbi:MAG: nuclear protein [Sediminibacterium sp.]|nr:nuclear protein [Sediminibacterium sp.]